MRKITIAALALIMILAFTPWNLHAVEIAGVTLEDTVQVGDKTLELTGIGIRTKTFLKVKVYVAGLYMESPSTDPKQIISTDEAKRFFIQSIGPTMKPEAIKKALWAGFDANTPDRQGDLQQKMETVTNFFTEPAKKGDTFGFSYEPSSGTSVTINGKEMGTISGKDIMEAVFAIWFGDKLGDGGLKALKKSMLEGM